MKKKLAILISGHLRNLNEIIDNFYNNLIIPISSDFLYHIYIHTWDDNFTQDTIMNNDQNYIEIKIVTVLLLNIVILVKIDHVSLSRMIGRK